MRSLIPLIVLLISALPGAVFAHATPVESVPRAGERLTVLESVSIRFSERLEEASSRITVKSPEGVDVAQGPASVTDDYRLSVFAPSETAGIYIVSWSVVSKDDGHFTKGSFAFAVGSTTQTVPVSDTVVVQEARMTEALAMFIEFAGNSVLWAVLLMFAFVIRPSLDLRGSTDIQRFLSLYSFTVIGGVLAVIAGGALQIVFKSQELALLHGIAFVDAIPMYVSTAAGGAVVARIVAIVVLGAVYALGRRAIVKSANFTAFEWGIVACLLVFAYFRAIISHATANPFYPEFSVLVNVVHLVEKDLWLGILVITSLLLISRLRGIVEERLERIFVILNINFATIAMTASYIIWLHLKDPSFISSTMWGERFLYLAAPAMLLIGMRAYHTIAYRLAPQVLSRLLPYTIGAEAALAALVVFFSSLLIITSPPLQEGHSPTLTKKDQGVVVTLARSLHEDGTMSLVFSEGVSEPIVFLGGEEGLRIPLDKRFEGGYVFPSALIEDAEGSLSVIGPREEGYDIRTDFSLTPDTFALSEARSFDMFTMFMVLLAIAGAASGAVLTMLVRGRFFHVRVPSMPVVGIGVGVLLGCIIGAQSALSFAGAWGNEFKERCLDSGNMWHLMQPTKAGVFLSQTPREGCMMFSGLYHITDQREFEYLRTLGTSTIAFDAGTPVAGTGTTLSFALTEKDGTPAKLGKLHERILHVIIVGSDMDYFAHVHPEEAGHPKTRIEDSRFAITHTFPKAGKYLIALDYLHGLTPETQMFSVDVGGVPSMGSESEYRKPRVSDASYTVEQDLGPALAGEQSIMRFTVQKNGAPVMDMNPYLGAAMHVAIVKNDGTEFVHTHGEWHPPGYVPPPVTTDYAHNHAPPPPQFGPSVEVHAVFPTPGTYTIFGEFLHDGQVIRFATTHRAE